MRHSLKRNVLSGRFVWRCIKIWEHLTRALDTHRSKSFYLGCMKGEKMKWKVSHRANGRKCELLKVVR